MNAQDSLEAQLRRLVELANREGLYDAADWVVLVMRERVQSKRPEGDVRAGEPT